MFELIGEAATSDVLCASLDFEAGHGYVLANYRGEFVTWSVHRVDGQLWLATAGTYYREDQVAAEHGYFKLVAQTLPAAVLA